MKPDLGQTKVFVHIQLLRAIAILMVLGFHLNLPGFKFGYLGVDIFFVISGFLMMKIYSNLGINKIQQFYLKRLLRLIPAFLVVSLLTTLIFLTFILPYEKVSLVKQNLYASLLISNFYYWTENQYFVNSGLRPLLTFWSLALEIQFYLIFPLIFFVVKKNMKILVFITSISLTVFVLLENISPETGFFLLPGRLWEFLVGVWLANFLLAYRKKIRVSLFSFRLALISFPTLILIFDLTSIDIHVYLNLLAVIYTLAILFIGFYWRENKNLLDGFGLLIGRYSYSIYLVHLPIISLIYYKPFSNDLKIGSSWILNLVSIFLVVVFSFVLFNLVEQPFRQSGRKKFIYMYSFFLLFSIGLTITLPHFKYVGTDSTIRKISYSQEDRPSYRCGTLARIEVLHKLARGPESCLLSAENSGKRFLLVGNSHANSIQSALNSKLELAGNSLYILRDASVLNFINLPIVKSEVIDKDIDVIVLHSSPGQLDKPVFDNFFNFVSQNGKKLIIIGPIPTYSESVPSLVYRNYVRNEPFELKTLQFFYSVYMDEIDYYEQLSKLSNVYYFNSIEVFCTPFCRLTDINVGDLFYFDDTHLTNTGADYLLNDFIRAIGFFQDKNISFKKAS
jgi:peptidoglycan/LPS O-acetylase OafA/YrhL